MGFCPVCGAHHDPNVPCADRAGELLGDIGLKKIPKKRRNEFKHLQEVVDRSMIKLVLIVLTFVILFILFGVMAERSKWWLLGWAILTIILISLIIYPMHKFKKR